jgi:hypothetical protein
VQKPQGSRGQCRDYVKRAPAEPPNARLTNIRSPASGAGANDGFFRFIVAGMRNGALAFTRAGVLTLINDEAYRILEIAPGHTDLGRAVDDVLGT